MDLKKVLIYGGILAVGVVGFIVLNRKKKVTVTPTSSAARINQLSQTKPAKVTAAISTNLVSMNSNFSGNSIL